jgi:hypothetical protein
VQENISDTEIIRRSALKILAKYPEGVRPTQLKIYTEEALGKWIQPDTNKSRGKYRSAIWNLHERFSNFVIKKTFANPRVTIFIPTDLLQNEWQSIEVPDLEKQKRLEMMQKVQLTHDMLEIIKRKKDHETSSLFSEDSSDEPDFSASDIIKMININVMEIVDLINDTGIYYLIEDAINVSDYIYSDETEALYRLKFCLDMLTKYRNELLHKKF